MTAARPEFSPFALLVQAQGLSLEELAEVSGLSRHTVSRLAVDARPGEATAHRLAAILGVTVTDVLDPAGWMTRSVGGRIPARRLWLEHAFGARPTGDDNWRDAAACRSADPELFWPAADEYPSAALSMCARCPVVGDCREDFQRSELPDYGGVWFGTTPSERVERRCLLRSSDTGRAA